MSIALSKMHIAIIQWKHLVCHFELDSLSKTFIQGKEVHGNHSEPHCIVGYFIIIHDYTLIFPQVSWVEISLCKIEANLTICYLICFMNFHSNNRSIHSPFCWKLFFQSTITVQTARIYSCKWITPQHVCMGTDTVIYFEGVKGVLYSILGPNLLGLTVAVWNIVGRCFSAVCRGLNNRRYSELKYTNKVLLCQFLEQLDSLLLTQSIKRKF